MEKTQEMLLVNPKLLLKPNAIESLWFEQLILLIIWLAEEILSFIQVIIILVVSSGSFLLQI